MKTELTKVAAEKRALQQECRNLRNTQEEQNKHLLSQEELIKKL
jgi:hypothetical protein